MKILILGAGFGGLELSSRLSEELGDKAEVTLIDKSDAFMFGFSKLDLMFGHGELGAMRLPYARIAKPGVRFRQETVTAIDAATRRVRTNAGEYEADALVIALGAEYDCAATPGLIEGKNEFYSVAGALHLRDTLSGFKQGHAVIGVSAAPYKCPPAPSECALMLHDYLATRGTRGQCSITMVLLLPSPVPPSPETSKALIAAFAERNITFMPGRRVANIDETKREVALDDGTRLPCNLYLGVPKHRPPAVVAAAGLAVDGWVPIIDRSMVTKYPGVYCVGDIANTGAPKAGVFAEGAARAVAQTLVAQARGQNETGQFAGAGSCYIEFGAGRIGRVDVDFFSGPKPTGKYYEPSVELREDKERFGRDRRSRWFGM